MAAKNGNVASNAVSPLYNNDENKQRGNWSNKFDFILSAIGCAVGLGNIWRFPYRAYANGGASFLIPYTITLVVAGLPLYYFELALGQFASLGPISVWKAVPLFKGIGWTMVAICCLCAIYYNMILAYILRYLFASFTATLPWQHCNPEWSRFYNCYERVNAYNMKADQDYNSTSTAPIEYGATASHHTATIADPGDRPLKTPAEIYWEYEVLGLSDGIDKESSNMKWDLVLCLLLAWIIVFLCLIKGIKSSGKVVYVTAILPYVVLIILLIWNTQLEGAWLGIKFYIVPEWHKLSSAKVWYSAGTQIFFSLGIAFGNISMMSSYNRFHNNAYRDAIVVTVVNCGTSIFGGFAIFSVIGFMATKTGLPVDKVAAGGPGLAFVAYPEGLAMMPAAPFWSVLFFVMLLTLGVDSQFAFIETVITAILDEFPVWNSPRRRMAFVGILCAALFIIGLPQCSRAGIYVVTLMDDYSVTLNSVVVGFIEVTAISWIYGVRRFCDDIEMMIGHKPNYYWIVCWTTLSPLLMAFLLVFSAVDYSRSSYDKYVFPDWANGIGWLILASTLAVIPATAAYEWVKARRSMKSPITPVQIIRHLLRPAPDWGPALSEYRTGRYSAAAGAAADANIVEHGNNSVVGTSSTAITGPPASSEEAVSEVCQDDRVLPS